VEIYQNCNVFNDGAFEGLTSKANREDMLIPLVHGEPIRFGKDQAKGVTMSSHGQLQVVDVADVGLENVLVHHEDDSRGLAFMLSRLSKGPSDPTPVGVFRAVESADHPEYGGAVTAQLAAAQARSGPGDLHTLLHSGATWTV
jgi:2-oxoglutarate ferredoxin oxidoreductase subunit beta